MSSTSVHSKKRSNTYLVGGVEVPKEDERIEMPPETAKPGPTIRSIRQEEKIEIPTQIGELDEKGTLRTEAGTVVGQYDEKVFRDAKKKEEERNARSSTTRKDEDKGTDRE